jgi:hypothetical protein
MEKIAYLLDPSVITALLAILMLGAWRFGVREGRRLRREKAITPQFDTASMALLGLLLAFAFGTSMAKYEQRRLAVVQDSNAIGDFYTCATLLREPIRSKLQTVIRAYAERRLKLAREPMSTSNFEEALTEFQQMHDQMTILVAQGLSAGTPIAVSLTNTLNAVTSNHAARLAAIRDRLPLSILVLLFASAVITTALIGRNQGFSESFDPRGVVLYVVLVSVAIYVTLDLNGPQRGFIRASQEPIERLLSSMQK